MLFRETVAVYCENHAELTDYCENLKEHTLLAEYGVLVC
jgi:hypothetical protein